MKRIISILLITHCSLLIGYAQFGWFGQASGTTNNLNAIYMITYEIGYAAGDNGTIIKTTNGGTSWFPLQSPTANNLRSIVFISNDTGIIAGANGTILKTFNAGANWSVRPSGTSADLNSVIAYRFAFSVVDTLWAVGNNGTILRSINRGENWTAISSPTSNQLRGIAMWVSNAWIVGTGGTILRSFDWGLNWNFETSPTTADLNGLTLSAAGSIKLFAAGNNGTILKSSNFGGWEIVSSGTSNNLYSIFAQNYYPEDFIHACGSGGVDVKSSDSGSNWTVRSTGTSQTLNSIRFLDPNTGWTAGSGGTIRKTISDTWYIDRKFLNTSAYRIPFNNDGSFCNPYEFTPYGSGHTVRYTSGLWIGATVGNDTLVTVAEYSAEYMPGYTDNNGIPHVLADSLYRIYKMTYGVNDLDRTFWPNALLGNSNQGAPVYYDTLASTWKPVDFGTQTMFYVYTDSDPGSHIATPGYTAPLKADVKQLNFLLDVQDPISNAAFTEFRIINRSTNVWNNVYVSVWTDDDIGEAFDDASGCDTILKLGYSYNKNASDPIWGSTPPAAGFLMLRGALVFTGNMSDTVYVCRNKTRIALTGYKDMGMRSFIAYPNGQDPLAYYQSYRLMSGFDRDGNVIINPVTGQPTKLMYSGDPITGQGWYQGSADDMRYFESTGPLTMNPGDTQVIVTAQVVARGSSNLNSLTQLKSLAEYVRQYYNSCYTSIPIGIETQSTGIPLRFKLFQNYPNPFNPATNLRFEISELRFVRLTVYDALGREVEILVNEELKPGTYEVEWDAAEFPSGVYFYQLSIVNSQSSIEYRETKRMVLLK